MVFNYRKNSATRLTKAMLLIALLAGLILTSSSVAKKVLEFDTPANLGSTVNSPAREAAPNISQDGLSLFFQSDRSDGYGGWDLWVCRRESLSNAWGAPINLGPAINSPVDEIAPNISEDKLTLYFSTNRMGSYGEFDIWESTRAKVSDPWGTPENLGRTVNSAYMDGSTSISSNGLELYISTRRTDGMGSFDIWMTTRITTEDEWNRPHNLGKSVNITASDKDPSISSDGLSLFFDSSRQGGYPGDEIWVTRRETANAPWGKAVNLGSVVNSQFIEASPNISSDGQELYFQSNRPGGQGDSDIWIAIHK